MDQISLFEMTMPTVRIENPIRLIELFAGYGSQAIALENLGANFETYKVVEFDKYAAASYNAVHGTDFPTIDVCNVHGKDLEIVDKDAFTYLLTHFLVRIFLSPDNNKDLKKAAEQGQLFCGKCREYLKN